MVGIHNVTVDKCLLRLQQHMISVPVKKHILFTVYTMMTGNAGLDQVLLTPLTLHEMAPVFYIKHAASQFRKQQKQQQKTPQLCLMTYFQTAYLKRAQQAF